MTSRQSKSHMGKEALFWALFFSYTAFSFYLFYQQAMERHDGLFRSNMPDYIDAALDINRRAEFPNRLFFIVLKAIHAVFPTALSAALTTALFNSVNVFILRHFIDKLLAECENEIAFTTKKGRSIVLAPYVTVLVVFSCLFSSMIALPVNLAGDIPLRCYAYLCSGNPWHDAVYLTARPFATLAFFLFAELLDDLKRRLDTKKLTLFSLSLCLSVFAMPSFAYVMLPSAVGALLIQLIAGRFKTVVNTLFLGLALLPAAGELLRQRLAGAEVSPGSGIGFDVGFIRGWYVSRLPFFVTLCAFAFAIYILISNIGRLDQRTLFRFSSVFLVFSLFAGVFLYDKSAGRMVDDVFLQGGLFAAFYLFAAASVTWVASNKAPKRKPLYNLAALLLFMAHTLYGVSYFIFLLKGYSR